MAVYIGASPKLKILVGNTVCSMIVYPSVTIIDGTRLFSNDDFELHDKNDILLTSQYGDEDVYELITSDNEVLVDSNIMSLIF